MKGKLYCGIDLHSNNSVVVMIDDEDRVVYEKRLPNLLDTILFELSRYKKKIAGVVVESTFNYHVKSKRMVFSRSEDGEAGTSLLLPDSLKPFDIEYPSTLH